MHSVESALCRVHNDLIKDKANGICSFLILLDLSSAFDTVDLDLLLEDLSALGVTGSVYEWLRSYLVNRSFSVVIDGCVSDTGEIKSGVPQGSILGPLLFVIYTSSLQYVLGKQNVSFHLYADDTQIYFRIKNTGQDIDKINNIRLSIEKWMNARKLKLNLAKTEIMAVGSNMMLSRFNFSDVIGFGNLELPLSSKLRNLGVIFDKNLSMHDQINNVKRKSIAGLISIARISNYIDRGSRIKLVHSLVLSHLDSCNSLYYGLPKTVLHPLQMIINSAARIIVRMPHYSRERITPVCIDLHFLPLKARIEYKLCLLVYKALNFNQPRYLADLLSPFRTESVVELRSTGRLNEPFVSRSSLIERAFEFSAPRLYNSIPIEIRSQETLNCFKGKLKTYLFQKAYNLIRSEINEAYAV